MKQLTRNWWILALRGAVSVVLGLIAFLLPALTLAALVILFGAFALVDGVTRLSAGFRALRDERRWWALILQGLLGIATALVTLFVPLATALALLWVVAAWAVVSGGFEIAAAIRLRREIRGEWLLVLSGALSLFLGLMLVLMPGIGLLTLAWMVGAYLLASGLVLLLFAFRLRRVEKGVGASRRGTAEA